MTRALEIISEASRRISEDLKAKHPDVPWQAIRDAGNVYRRKYDRVSVEFVWDTARCQLAALAKAVADELGAESH